MLTVRVEAQAAEKTVWLVELQQAGAFGIRNVPAQDMQRLLGIFCPNYLLPYAREVVSDLLTQGRLPAVPVAAGELRRAVRAGCGSRSAAAAAGAGARR